MISWIKGELIEFWQTNNKFFALINCNGLGYEVQIIESVFLNLKTKKISNKNITFWIKHIKKEDTDLLFGFTSKDQRSFFIEILNIRGIGSQIGMALLNKFTVSVIMNAINTQNKKLICSVPGVGKKMTERLILELKNKFKNELMIKTNTNVGSLFKNTEINKILDDLELTLKSLNYSKNEINSTLTNIIKDTKTLDLINKREKNISFENLLKLAMNYLDNDSSNYVS